MTDPRYICPTFYLDCDHPAIIDFVAATTAPADSPLQRAVSLFYAVRDGYRYNPYAFFLEKEKFKASHTLAAGEGFCVPKAILLTAAARAAGIPARLGFGNVKNHLATTRLKKMMGTDLFVFHGYAELFLNDQWVKATPAFNKSLCEKFDILPLEFDGSTDAVFHPYDKHGQQHMEYVHDYGSFDDFPYELMLSEWGKHYAFTADGFAGAAGGDLEKERDEYLAQKKR